MLSDEDLIRLQVDVDGLKTDVKNNSDRITAASREFIELKTGIDRWVQRGAGIVTGVLLMVLYWSGDLKTLLTFISGLIK
jgi:hypothetical protein